MKRLILLMISGLFVAGCSQTDEKKAELEKGFQVNEVSQDSTGKKELGVRMDITKLDTRPGEVIKTKHPEHRLTTVFLVNINHKTKKKYTGSNHSVWNWHYDELEGNNWQNYMPGFDAIQGYNMVNVSHHNTITNTENKLFEHPVLIRTLYYPAFSRDTLKKEPVSRGYYMVSVYDEDTNEDGYINYLDLRRIYYFDINGLNKRNLVPKDYAVMSSQYDWDNDYMYIYARQDKNGNGQMESEEPTSIFWVDLKNPESNGLHYSPDYN